MTGQMQQTKTSGKVKAVSVADYIVERLAAEGINHCFGVAGDYLFPICDAVDSSAKVKWIGCASAAEMRLTRRTAMRAFGARRCWRRPMVSASCRP